MKRVVIAAATSICLAAGASIAGGQTLKGSTQTMQAQNRIAQQHDYTFLRDSKELRRFVDAGLLQRVPENASLELVSVSHPYARPAVKLFLERLSSQHLSACGEALVVTSLTRPVLEQPRNASELSVHPAGMAVDLRISRKASCQRWLETTLLALERRGVLDVTRERRPPHYHVALYPERYTSYVAQLGGGTPARVATSNPPAKKAAVATAPARPAEPVAQLASAAATPERSYRVNRGDSLWSIARRHGTTVETLQELNGLRGTQLVAGQVIAIPTVAAGAESQND